MGLVAQPNINILGAIALLSLVLHTKNVRVSWTWFIYHRTNWAGQRPGKILIEYGKLKSKQLFWAPFCPPNCLSRIVLFMIWDFLILISERWRKSHSTHVSYVTKAMHMLFRLFHVSSAVISPLPPGFIFGLSGGIHNIIYSVRFVNNFKVIDIINFFHR